MKEENILPADFDGVFRFTNWTDEDFKASWDKVEYTFPANRMTPILIPNATPLEIQNIRKKFARELAIREFYKTPKFVGMNNITPGGVPALYTDSDLTDFVQKCLVPLPIGQIKAQALPKDSEKNYRKDNKGKNVTRVVDQDESLVGNGTVMA